MRPGRLLRQFERLTGHAPAPVHAERHCQRKLARGECRDVLDLIVFVDVEVAPTQSGHELARVSR